MGGAPANRAGRPARRRGATWWWGRRGGARRGEHGPCGRLRGDPRQRWSSRGRLHLARLRTDHVVIRAGARRLRVCAAGDLTGLRPSTHVSVATGRVAAATLLGRDVSFDPAWVPQVVCTDPQVAVVGEVPGEPGTRSARVPVSHADRALVAAVPGREDRSRGGLAQAWVAPEADGGFSRGGRLAGALLVGPHAGELVGEVAMAGRLGLSVEEWAGGLAGLGAVAAQHAYPTWSWLWDSVAERLLRPDVTGPDVTRPDVTRRDVTGPDVTRP